VSRAFTRYTSRPAFENVVHRNPVHASGLHRDGPDLALLQPFGHRLQLRCGAPEAPHRLAVARLRYSYVVRFVADINTSGIRMYHLQAEVSPNHPEGAAEAQG
jgi:hypothetical protein